MRKYKNRCNKCKETFCDGIRYKSRGGLCYGKWLTDIGYVRNKITSAINEWDRNYEKHLKHSKIFFNQLSNPPGYGRWKYDWCPCCFYKSKKDYILTACGDLNSEIIKKYFILL